jgi:hypothetical protein
MEQSVLSVIYKLWNEREKDKMKEKETRKESRRMRDGVMTYLAR